jgi:hypothetical protein
MSRVGQTVRIRGGIGGGGGARAVGSYDDWAELGPGQSWVQTYLDPGGTDWDILGEGYFDETDEMVVPADGIYWVSVGHAVYGGDTDMTSGYYAVEITLDGAALASHAWSFQQSVSTGYVDETGVSWVGSAEAGQRFAAKVTNNTNLAELFVGNLSPYICVLRIA